jgi:hypothetical protein
MFILLKYIKNKINLKLVLMAIAFCYCQVLSAQIKISYSIGAIGGNMKTSTYSNPLLIAGQNCFNVSNTLSKFWVSNKGDFFTTCAVDMEYINFSININPNPVTNFAVVKFLNKLQNESQFRLTVFTSIGQPIIAKDVIQDELLTGYRLDMSNLSTGYYYVQVASPRLLRSYKIFKN